MDAMGYNEMNKLQNVGIVRPKKEIVVYDSKSNHQWVTKMRMINSLKMRI